MTSAIGINFIRPYATGAHAFAHESGRAISRIREMGISRIRLLIPQTLFERDPAPWADTVALCRDAGTEILAVLRGEGMPASVLDFYRAVQSRFGGDIACWELDIPCGTSPDRYAEDILRPAYAAMKEAQPDSIILPDSDSRLPAGFYAAARGAFDAAHTACLPEWGFLRLETGCEADIATVRDLRARLDAAGCGSIPLWITEAGWFGLSGLTGELADHYNTIPDYLGEDETIRDPIADAYTGAALLEHPLTRREDVLCARWMAACYPALREAGAERIYHTRIMDEFAGGYRPDGVYRRGEATLWGVLDGSGALRECGKALAALAKEG